MLNSTPAAHPEVTPIERGELTIVKIHINACVAAMRDEDGRTKSRELSLAVTKLQEATFWIEEHQRLA